MPPSRDVSLLSETAANDLDARALEVRRLKGEFLANLSHELRAPLHTIIGFAELMRRGKVGAVSPEHGEYLGDILTSAQRLLRLIDDVIELSRVETGRVELRPRAVEVAALIAEVQEILRGAATARKVEASVRVEPAVERVTLDPVRFKQVVYNYLSNAVRHSPVGGRVEVRVSAVPGAAKLRVEVEDAGVGVAPEDMPRLFVEFQRLAPGAREGSGVGLALTRHVVEAQGGEVGVTSVYGRGSTFWAVLPFTHDEGPPKEDRHGSTPHPHRR
jgi:signal transduction histidine kinase